MKSLLPLVALAALLLPDLASGASIFAWDIATLTQRSDRVVEVRVEAVRGERLPDGDLRTVHTLEVETVLKGARATALSVVKGSATVGDVTKTIHGDMDLVVGGRYVLFLSEREGDLHSTLLGWSVFRIDGAGDGAELTRNLEGLALLYRAPDGSLVPATDLDIAAATPRTLGGLRREVEASR